MFNDDIWVGTFRGKEKLLQRSFSPYAELLCVLSLVEKGFYKFIPDRTPQKLQLKIVESRLNGLSSD